MNKFLSLGNNCFIKKYLNTIQPGETNFFDYIGSSQWSINELFLNDFANLFNKEDYVNTKVLTDYECVTHKHYYLRFLHDLHLWTFKTPILNVLKLLFLLIIVINN